MIYAGGTTFQTTGVDVFLITKTSVINVRIRHLDTYSCYKNILTRGETEISISRWVDQQSQTFALAEYKISKLILNTQRQLIK